MAGEKPFDPMKEAMAAPQNERSQENQSLNKAEHLEQPKALAESVQAQEGKATDERTVNPNATIPRPLPPIIDPQLEKRRKQIEGILAENLTDAYQGLTREQQVKFKTVGESTASQINILLSETKIKINKIINLIITWLTILPGINKFFLEKEAKIKTDAIIQLKKGGEQ